MDGGEEDSNQGLRVFVSYRRDDASGYAGRLYDGLVERFGSQRVFMDLAGIRPGRDFAVVIDQALAQCDVLLAMVGKGWVASSDRTGRRRLDNPDDFVRLEIEAALRRGVTIIPVLVQGADMPLAGELPGPLAAFTRRQAFELSDRRWAVEVEELIDELERLEAEKGREAALDFQRSPRPRVPEQKAAPQRTEPVPVIPRPQRRRAAMRTRVAAACASAVLLVAGVVGLVVIGGDDRPVHLIPDLKGKPLAEAQTELQAFKLRAVVRHEFSDLPPDSVIGQEPFRGRAKEGTTVTLVVSQGRDSVDVPDLGNKAERDAINELVNSGLKPGTVTRRSDPAPEGQVLAWSPRTRQPKGTAVDLTVSSGSGPTTTRPPPTPLAPGPLPAGRYVTSTFEPRITFSAKAGWVVDEVGVDRVVLSPVGRPASRLSLVRAHRVYNPNSPNTDQRELVTTNDALNSVQDVREFPNGLAAFLAEHPRRISGLGGVTPATRAGRTGTRVDAQFRPYDYEGCETPPVNRCVPLFQLSSEPGRTSAVAFVGTERVRFEIFDVVVGAKLVVMTSAPERDFAQFVAEASDLLSFEQIDFTERISTPLVRSSRNPSAEGEPVTLIAEVPRQCSSGGVVFTNLLSTGPQPLGTATVVNGMATVTTAFFGRGDFARVVAEHDGSDCTRGFSAPVFQRVQ